MQPISISKMWISSPLPHGTEIAVSRELAKVMFFLSENPLLIGFYEQ
jgi:hypothetical protein